ncbi:MAG: type III pantothenate kinase [Helicobacteraceae bacterium]|jgi:type III pantothenate kinase|nr:type III pantothenate kinase [Helicobacteraceae bacterium]
MEDHLTLCDIGNTTYHFYDGKSDLKASVDSFDPASRKDDIYYISVNPKVDAILSKLANWHDLSNDIEWENYYETMGVDRIVACEAIDDGLIIDAGSAITVDLVILGHFEGGFIYPGLDAMQESYRNISSRLDYSLNFELDLDKMPKNSQDAISYGVFRTLYSEVMRHNKKIYLTGGNAKALSKIFPDAEVDELLLFKGMKKMMEKRC